MDFVNLKQLQDNCPVVLIDMSGSTTDPINVPGDFEARRVIDYEISIVKKLFQSKGINQIYLAFWNYQLKIASNSPINISSISSYKPGEPFGSTLLATPLKSIPSNWFAGKPCSELYIVTDGEIEDGNNITEQLKYLHGLKTKIQIITVEPNSFNYLNPQENPNTRPDPRRLQPGRRVNTSRIAGSSIYEAIKNNNLTSLIRRFSSYNEFHTYEPFISFDNPEQIDGYAVFDGKYFSIENSYDDFVDYIDDKLTQCKNPNGIFKLAHELSLTIHHIGKNKSIEEQTQITQELSDLFANTPVDLSTFNKINTLLITEAENHSKGKSSIYQEFRDALVVRK